MGVALGSVVDASASGGVEGLPYLVFLAPGLLAASAMQTGAGEGSYPVMAGIKWTKSYQAALATPVSSGDILLGTLGWAALRVAMVCVVFAVVMVGFGAASPLGALLSVGPAVLTGVAMAAPVMAFTARLEKETGLGQPLPVRRGPDVPLQRHLLPGQPAPRLDRVGRLDHTAVARGRPGPGGGSTPR